jgi:hypothetical protein
MSEKTRPDEMTQWLPPVSAILILILGIYVALFPVVYTPVSKTVLFLLVAILPGILFGSSIAVRFKFELLGTVITATGVAGILFALIFLLNYLAAPDKAITGFWIQDETGKPVNLRHDLVAVRSRGGLEPTYYIDEEKDRLLMIFAEQFPTVTLCIQEFTGDQEWCGSVSYAGPQDDVPLVLGKDMVR